MVNPQAQLVHITPAVQAPTPVTPAEAPEGQLWAWLAEVPDPEIPVVSVVDLGIVRSVAWSTTQPASEPATVCVTVTPTYSGCPATEVIGTQIREALLARGVPRVELEMQLSPPWTTDWMTDRARENLRAYGIVPPTERETEHVSGIAASLLALGQGAHRPLLHCPRCGSTETETVSRFGSTPCKSLHRCLTCLEPFDHFKCH